jgi:hypothetical protein
MAPGPEAIVLSLGVFDNVGGLTGTESDDNCLMPIVRCYLTIAAILFIATQNSRSNIFDYSDCSPFHPVIGQYSKIDP